MLLLKQARDTKEIPELHKDQAIYTQDSVRKKHGILLKSLTRERHLTHIL